MRRRHTFRRAKQRFVLPVAQGVSRLHTVQDGLKLATCTAFDRAIEMVAADVKRKSTFGRLCQKILDKPYRGLSFRIHRAVVRKCLQHSRLEEAEAQDPHLFRETRENALPLDGLNGKDAHTAVAVTIDIVADATAAVPTVAAAKIRRGPSAVARANVDIMASTMCIITITEGDVGETMTVAIRGATDCLPERPIRTLVVPTALRIIINTQCWMPATLAVC